MTYGRDAQPDLPARSAREMTIAKNDIVQIISPEHHWFPALIVVEEVKDWGIQGYAHVLHNDEQSTGQAHIRLEHKDYLRVGAAIVIMGESVILSERTQ